MEIPRSETRNKGKKSTARGIMGKKIVKNQSTKKKPAHTNINNVIIGREKRKMGCNISE